MLLSIRHHQYDGCDQRNSHHTDISTHYRSIRRHHSKKDVMIDSSNNNISNTSSSSRNSSNHRSLQHHHHNEKDHLMDSNENTNNTSRSSRSCFSSSTNNISISNGDSMRQNIHSEKQIITTDNVRPYDQNYHHPISSLQSPRDHQRSCSSDENINRPLKEVQGSVDTGLNRAIYVKTGNSLYSDIEYYEYTMPKSSSSSTSSSLLQQRPPRTPQSSQKNKAMSEFARSAYLTASPI